VRSVLDAQGWLGIVRSMETPPPIVEHSPTTRARDFKRFLTPHGHLSTTFGSDWFGRNAELFARFFGTPTFLITQTVLVGAWILSSLMNWTKFDPYPFILLNLAFSLQAAYAAPLILLAQTRQADRDKAHSEADAEHREEVAVAMEKRQKLLADQTHGIMELLRQNTELTETVRKLSIRIEELTVQLHQVVVEKGTK
jgi:uncharacterized membrane protein